MEGVRKGPEPLNAPRGEAPSALRGPMKERSPGPARSSDDAPGLRETSGHGPCESARRIQMIGVHDSRTFHSLRIDSCYHCIIYGFNDAIIPQRLSLSCRKGEASLAREEIGTVL